MNIKNFSAVLIILVCFNISTYSQRHPGIQNLLNQFGLSTYSYLLTANRPIYSVDAEIVEKSKIELNTGFDAGGQANDIPFSFNYGAGKNIELFAGMDLFNQSYNFTNKKISGVGDANLGIKYRFQNSEKFSHVLQVLVKIPTASKETELGTGKADFHFGLAQAYNGKVIGYDLSLEMNMLGRRDFPGAKKYAPPIQRAVDSLAATYDYKYEPEVILTFGPDFNVSDKVILYTGYSFDRNTRLNYNSSLLFGGMVYNASDRVAISLGGSYGLEQAGTWNISGGLNILLN